MDIYKIIKSEYSLIIENYNKKIIDLLINKFKKENNELSDNIIIKYISDFYELKNSNKIKEKDILKYNWKDLENTVDSNRKIDNGRIKKEDKIKISNADLIYNKNNLKIFLSNSHKSCVTHGSGYSFCVSTKHDKTMYDHYRLKEKNTIYFILDMDKDKSKNGKTFNDPNHLLVLMVNSSEYNKRNYLTYQITTANNDEDFTFTDWNVIKEYNPKLFPLKNLFKIKDIDEKEQKEYDLKIKYENILLDLVKKYQDMNYYFDFFYVSSVDDIKISDIDSILKKEVIPYRYKGYNKYNFNFITQNIIKNLPSEELWKNKMNKDVLPDDVDDIITKVEIEKVELSKDDINYLTDVKNILLNYRKELSTII